MAEMMTKKNDRVMYTWIENLSLQLESFGTYNTIRLRTFYPC